MKNNLQSLLSNSFCLRFFCKDSRDFVARLLLEQDLCFWLKKGSYIFTKRSICIGIFSIILSDTCTATFASRCKKTNALMDATLMVRVASKDYVAVVSGLDAESMYWTNSKTWTQKHVNIQPRFENIRIPLYYWDMHSPWQRQTN